MLLDPVLCFLFFNIGLLRQGSRSNKIDDPEIYNFQCCYPQGNLSLRSIHFCIAQIISLPKILANLACFLTSLGTLAL